MPRIVFQRGGGYTYRWECAILLTPNYLFEAQQRYDSANP
jgi:hypothetical protein